MFERFTQAARRAVVLAQEEARDAGADHVGAEHLLYGVLHEAEEIPAVVLRTWDVDARRVSALARTLGDLDEEALSALGIDLDHVRRTAEAEFGPGALDGPRWGRHRRRRVPGHVPFTDEAKRTLELALVAALEAHERELTVAHLFLGLLRTDAGTTLRLLHRLGVPASADELPRLVRAHRDDAA
ncbi:Clp protease N-terminal domain-containing protein [Microlunatus flavus]|uniref:Clp amino terminal domain-containing protein, pathogenicity island component n=1 Tax=Microlunatus flavus TaxID=1036181 RepID=A0A1H9FD30_9ACTN|nr:Clp protease N-terminal domain-containing protein [Microlunatus flavus]SEQ35822.1 Clp amino terminal domain-containing protein, pathogenicity island component [Microlunatus flavus]